MTPDLERMQRRMDIALGRPLDRYGAPTPVEPQVLRFYDPEAATRVTDDARRVLADMSGKLLDVMANHD